MEDREPRGPDLPCRRLQCLQPGELYGTRYGRQRHALWTGNERQRGSRDSAQSPSRLLISMAPKLHRSLQFATVATACLLWLAVATGAFSQAACPTEEATVATLAQSGQLMSQSRFAEAGALLAP